MLRGLLQLTWLEIKIFLREPLGAVGALVFPVLGYLVIGRLLAGRGPVAPREAREAVDSVRVVMPVMGALLISITRLKQKHRSQIYLLRRAIRFLGWRKPAASGRTSFGSTRGGQTAGIQHGCAVLVEPGAHRSVA